MNNLPGILIIFRLREPEQFGGIPRKILIIAEWLKKQGVFLPVLLTSKNLKFSKAFSDLGLPVQYVDMTGANALRRTRKAANRLIKKYNIKIEEGIYHKPEYWKYKPSAKDTTTSGIFHHAHTVTEGKWDMSPQPILIDMLNGLKNAV